MNRCETCRHWFRERHTGPDGKWVESAHGECNRIGFHDIDYVATPDAGAPGSALETDKHFGCVLWEEKE